jgi:hypothetical protein
MDAYGKMQQFNALASMMPRYEAPQLDANAFTIGRV